MHPGISAARIYLHVYRPLPGRCSVIDMHNGQHYTLDSDMTLKYDPTFNIYCIGIHTVVLHATNIVKFNHTANTNIN